MTETLGAATGAFRRAGRCKCSLFAQVARSLDNRNSCGTTDIDVVYWDIQNADPESDLEIERRLTSNWSDISWSVRNQARMHVRIGGPPYRSTEDALAGDCNSAVGRASSIVAPQGVDDLVRMIVRPTPAFDTKISVYDHRLASRTGRGDGLG